MRTSCSWSGTSVMTISASRSSSTARTVSRPGSPGPLPTKETHFTGRAARSRLGCGVLDVFCLVTIAFLLLRCFVDQFCCALGEHLCGELLAEADGIVERTGRGPSYGEGAVGRERDCTDPQFVTEVPFRNFGQGADRGRAPRFELGEQCPLRLDAGAGGAGRRGRRGLRHAGRRRRGTRPRGLPGRARAAPGAGRAPRWPRRRGRAGPARRGRARPRRARRRRPCRGGCPRCRGRRPARCRGRARASWATRRGRAGADAGAGGQLAEGEPVAGDDHVARVLARRYGGQRDAVGRRGGQVLERVHGEVDLAAQQRLAQRADEDAGAADLGQRRGGDVALGADRRPARSSQPGGSRQGVGDQLALGAGQGGGAGADADRCVAVT